MPSPKASLIARVLPVGLALFVAILAAGCAADVPQTTVVPKTDSARIIQELYETTFWGSVIVFIGIQGGLLYMIFRFRYRRGAPLPPQTHGNTPLEIAWTIAPAIILVWIAVPTIRGIFALEGAPPTNDYMTIEVIGKQWWWEFKYPDQKIVTANELVVPAGKTVYLKMTSDDVIHSFWIPQLMGKQDVMAGQTHTLWFTADEPGQYFGQCAEYCGVEHALMRMSAIVYKPVDFDAWVARNQKPGTPTTELAEKGAQVFAQNACVGCHTIAGTNAQAKIGPDLSHFGSRSMVVAGTMPNTTENLAAWIRNPQAVKPGNKMPTLNLAPDELEAVVEYLHSLK